MDAKLLEILQKITPEEQKILEGNPHVEMGLYTSGKDFVIDSAKMLEKGKLIDIRTHTRFAEFPKHRHNYIEITYMCRGKTVHVVNDSTTIELEEGDLLFLNKHASHRILPAGGEDIAVNFMILPQFFDVALGMMDRENLLTEFVASSLRDRPGEHDILHFRAKDILPVQNLVENLVYSTVTKAGNRREIDRATMGVLFLQLLNHTDRIEPVGSEPEDFFAAAALRYAEENYRDASLTELAASLNQSVSSLSKAVKRAAGKTFSELVQSKRLQRAEQLLRFGDLTVSEIIEAVGYENTSYFYRVFRQAHGVSPKQFRKNCRSSLNGK